MQIHFDSLDVSSSTRSGHSPAYIVIGVFCVDTATHLPFSFTYTRENRTCGLMLFPFCVPFSTTRPITTAVLPYTRMFKSDSSRDSNFRAPDLKPSRIWAFVNIWPHPLLTA